MTKKRYCYNVNQYIYTAIIKKQYFNNNKIILRNYKFKLDIKKLIIKEHFLIAVLKTLIE